MESETQMLEQFGERELQMHIASGRIEYREGPWTEGVYNYRDKGDLVKRTRVTKNKGQEFQSEEDENEFQELMDMDATTHLQTTPAWGNKRLGQRWGRKERNRKERPSGHYGQGVC